MRCSPGRGKRLNIANSEKVNCVRLLGYANFMRFHSDTLKMGTGGSTNKLYESRSLFAVALELLVTQGT